MQTSAKNTDNVVTRRVYHFHYNNEDNPDYVDAFDENNTTTNPNLKFKFYYETYDDGLSIDEASLGEGLAIYPNPFTSELTIHGQQRKVVDCQVALINLLVQSVLQSDLTLQPGQNKIYIPFSIPKGIYIVDITEKGKRQFSGKFVRQ